MVKVITCDCGCDEFRLEIVLDEPYFIERNVCTHCGRVLNETSMDADCYNECWGA